MKIHDFQNDSYCGSHDELVRLNQSSTSFWTERKYTRNEFQAKSQRWNFPTWKLKIIFNLNFGKKNLSRWEFIRDLNDEKIANGWDLCYFEFQCINSEV